MEILIFHKPYGVLSQFKSVPGKRCLQEFPELAGGKAVGRLDEDSEGLLVISPLAWVQTALTRPGLVEKRYWAQIERIPCAETLQHWERGVELGDFTTAPARARLLPEPGLPEHQPPIRHRLQVPTCWLELILKEGKNRQVRRMTAALGHPTLRLLRVAIGELYLGDLKPGQSRPIRLKERAWLEKIR